MSWNQRLWLDHSTVLGRFLSQRDLQRLRRYEAEVIPLFDACTVASNNEMHHLLRLGFSTKVGVIPNSIDTHHFTPNILKKTKNSDILFVGQMSYTPNIDAATYFVQKIFPAILRAIPSARFFIVGQKPSDEVLKLHDGTRIIVTGEVPDTRMYHEQCSVIVTPIRYGGGTRIKILEAMAMSKAVVSTTVGAEGIPITQGKDIILADHEDEFAAQCVKLLLDHPLRWEIGHKAREFACKYFDSQLVEDRIRKYYASLKEAG